MNLAEATDHEVFEYLKLQDADAWQLVWERVVLVEARSLRSGDLARKKGLTTHELMSMLYVEMIGAGKIALYRDDGGSLWGWLRKYVHGYIHRVSTAEKHEISLDGADFGEEGEEDRDASRFAEKIAKKVSEAAVGSASLMEDPAVKRREAWDLVQKCFGDLWRQNPMRAYVHLLKLRMNLSSTEIKSMLGMTSEANVDQAFSRALKDMRKLKVEHEGE